MKTHLRDLFFIAVGALLISISTAKDHAVIWAESDTKTVTVEHHVSFGKDNTLAVKNDGDKFRGWTTFPPTAGTVTSWAGQVLTFVNEKGETVGRLDFTSKPMTFTGDADASAKVFFEQVIK